ncbi:methionyl-tRNA formyltransferase [Fulvivirgaceae bacterium LMO-SS25]
MNKDLKIVFYGTPEFAVPSLQTLVENGWQIAGVVTAPDKPQGRGRKINHSPVKEYALQSGLQILQPTNLKSPEFQNQLQEINPDLQIIVAFRMLPESVWSYPRLGTFNLHASLLPAYRGAAPINWAIINGEKQTGLTTFFLQHEIDTGEVIYQEVEPISEDDNAGTLYERLMNKGGTLVLKTVEAIAEHRVETKPQIYNTGFPKAPKLFKENCEIDWTKSAKEIYNFIRGLSPYPTAWTRIKDAVCKVYKSSYELVKQNYPPAHIETDNKNYIKVACKDGWVILEEIQMEGRKKMNVREFLNGYNL